MKIDSKFILSYKKLYKEIKVSEDPDEYIKNLALKTYPNQKTYNQKIDDFKKWYKFKSLLLNPLLKLYKIYYIYKLYIVIQVILYIKQKVILILPLYLIYFNFVLSYLLYNILL